MSPTMSITIRGVYYKCEEAAKILRLSPDTVQKYCKIGKLAGELIGREWHIPHREIKRYKRERNPRGRPRKQAG
jgi:excisionase family DNA binding protein